MMYPPQSLARVCVQVSILFILYIAPTRISLSNKGGGLFGRLKADGPKEEGGRGLVHIT
jgi:hypothetical protein